MDKHNESRRKLIKAVAYTAPVVLTLRAAPTFATSGSHVGEKCETKYGSKEARYGSGSKLPKYGSGSKLPKYGSKGSKLGSKLAKIGSKKPKFGSKLAKIGSKLKKRK